MRGIHGFWPLAVSVSAVLVCTCGVGSLRAEGETQKRQAPTGDIKRIIELNKRIDDLMARDDLWEAERNALELLRHLRPLLPPDAPEMCRQRTRLGAIYQGQGRMTEARELLAPAVGLLKRYDGSNDANITPLDYPQAVYLLASVESDMRNTGVALKYLDEMQTRLRQRRFDNDILMARAWKLRGMICSELGDFQLARHSFSCALR